MGELSTDSKLLVYAIAVLVGAWVIADATRRGKSGLAAFLWGLGACMLMAVFLPLWLVTRPKIGGEPAAPEARNPFAPPIPPVTPEHGDHHTRVCGQCGKFFTSDGDYCPYCGQPIQPPPEPEL